jgi:hypothetical protein
MDVVYALKRDGRTGSVGEPEAYGGCGTRQ